MREFVDDIGIKVLLPDQVSKVVSLCPSITETIFDLNAGNLLSGKTDYCIYPDPEVFKVPSVGKTLKVNIETVRLIKPDLVIASMDENNKENIEIIAKEFPVFTFDVSSFQDALNMILRIGELLNKKEKAREISDSITQSVFNHHKTVQGNSYLYFVWKNPWMLVSKQTFISDHLLQYGFENSLETNEPYPQFTDDGLKNIDAPDIILFPSEPYEFSQKDIAETQLLFPNSKVVLVKGEMICWYGSRMRMTGHYLKSLTL